MKEGELQKEFKRYIDENPRGFNQEYLNQLKLEIVEIKTEDEGWFYVKYKIHGFNYGEIASDTIGSSCEPKIFAKSIYQDIVAYSELLKKDKSIKKIIDKVDQEVDEFMEKINDKQRKSFWGFKRRYPMGDCHIRWEEKKRILKEDWDIVWDSPQDRMPDAKFD